MADTLRYVFAMLWVLSLLTLVIIDKKYPVGQPINENAYYIVGWFTLACMVGADNLTKLITSLINKFLPNGK